MRLWHFPSYVNAFFKRACAAYSGVRFFVGPFVYFYTSCVRTAKALARLCGCAGSPEPSLVVYVISTIRHMGWRLVRVMVLGSFQCRGVLLLWHMVRQGPAVLAAGAGRVGCIFFSTRLSYLPFLMPHLLGDGCTF